MSFEKVNVQKTMPNQDFDLVQFNKNFEDMQLLSRIKTTDEDVVFPVENPLGCYTSFPESLVDPKLSHGYNWKFMDKPEYINPSLPSETRFIIIVLVDKFTKKLAICLSHTNSQHTYWIPGGTPYVFENGRKAATRIFDSITKMMVSPDKFTKLYEEIVGKRVVTTYMTLFVDKFTVVPRDNMRWIPIKHLLSYNNSVWNNYYRQIYINLIQHVY